MSPPRGRVCPPPSYLPHYRPHATLTSLSRRPHLDATNAFDMLGRPTEENCFHLQLVRLSVRDPSPPGASSFMTRLASRYCLYLILVFFFRTLLVLSSFPIIFILLFLLFLFLFLSFSSSFSSSSFFASKYFPLSSSSSLSWFSSFPSYCIFFSFFFIYFIIFCLIFFSSSFIPPFLLSFFPSRPVVIPLSSFCFKVFWTCISISLHVPSRLASIVSLCSPWLPLWSYIIF